MGAAEAWTGPKPEAWDWMWASHVEGRNSDVAAMTRCPQPRHLSGASSRGGGRTWSCGLGGEVWHHLSHHVCMCWLFCVKNNVTGKPCFWIFPLGQKTDIISFFLNRNNIESLLRTFYNRLVCGVFSLYIKQKYPTARIINNRAFKEVFYIGKNKKGYFYILELYDMEIISSCLWLTHSKYEWDKKSCCV